MANERLRALEEVEKEIAMVLQCAGEDKLQCCACTSLPRRLLIEMIVGCVATGNIVLELSKDKHNASLLDRQLVQFQSSVNRVESELSGQIRYLTQVRGLIQGASKIRSREPQPRFSIQPGETRFHFGEWDSR